MIDVVSELRQQVSDTHVHTYVAKTTYRQKKHLTKLKQLCANLVRLKSNRRKKNPPCTLQRHDPECQSRAMSV